jgi:hypothetical protein|tara:strand:- start:100 stop:1107 length:1008 start_codon:yes stop_codon:yes gene_type:complete
MKKLLLSLATVLFISCEGEQKKSDLPDQSPMIGFWERVGTIQIVKGVNVDTIFWDDLELENKEKQIKAYTGNHFAWLSNAGINQPENKDFPWKTGAGAYGTYTFNSESKNADNMVETITNAIGNAVNWTPWDDLKKNGSISINFAATVTEKNYTQLGVRSEENDSIFVMNEETLGNTTEYAEYYEKIPEGEKTKIDGVWNHIADVRYVNGVAIDTTAVPEGLVDHKIFHRGNVIVNWDPTLAEKGNQVWGGAGLAGTYEYNKEKEELMEKFTLGTGNWMPKGNNWPDTYYDIDWIDEDTFIQIFRTRAVPSEDGSGLVWEEVGEEYNGHLNVRVK